MTGAAERETLHRSRCTVPWCEAEVIVWTEIQATHTTGLVVVTVPFCREHGPRVGSDV